MPTKRVREPNNTEVREFRSFLRSSVADIERGTGLERAQVEAVLTAIARAVPDITRVVTYVAQPGRTVDELPFSTCESGYICHGDSFDAGSPGGPSSCRAHVCDVHLCTDGHDCDDAAGLFACGTNVGIVGGSTANVRAIFNTKVFQNIVRELAAAGPRMGEAVRELQIEIPPDAEF